MQIDLGSVQYLMNHVPGGRPTKAGEESSGTTDLDATARSMDLLTVFILFSILTSFAG
jgi:hypothetical protein